MCSSDLMAKKEQELTASMIDTFREFKETKNIDRTQVQYSMWVTRKDAWYFANYDPRMKREGLHYVVIERNEKYMANFDEMVPEFIEKMDEALAEIGFVYGEQWQ